QADDAAVVLARDDEAGIRRVPDVVVEAVGLHVLAERARRDQRGNAFLREELVDLLLLLERLDELVLFVPVRLGGVGKTGRGRIDLPLLLLQLFVGQTLRFGLEADVRRIRTAVHHDRAAQLAANLVEVVLRLDVDHDRRGAEGRGQRRRERARGAGDPQ